MNKILMITTGGTLACTPSENGLVPTLTGKDILTFSKHKEADIDFLDFKLIDSSVMTDQDRQELADILWKNKDLYDSFIITHGTDSMAYTAAYLDCVLKNFKKSVILTGAQLPLMQKGTDAIDNVNLAVETAMNGYFGVCLAMHNRIISAKTATKFETEEFTAFTSVNNNYIEKSFDVPTDKETLLENTKNKVGLIYITPNLSAETIEMYDKFDALLVLVLGAGGMLKEQEKAFDKLKDNGVKIYIKSQCLYGKVEAVYEAHSGVKKFIPVTDSSIDWTMYAIAFGLI